MKFRFDYRAERSSILGAPHVVVAKRFARHLRACDPERAAARVKGETEAQR